MLDTINIGITGLQGFSRGLKVIANNTANMNTPGYKSGSLQFSTLFDGSLQNGQQGGGGGLNTGLTALNFTQGELQQSNNPLDMAIDGLGLFMLKGEDGNILYSRAGQFEFNSDGLLVNRADGKAVLGVGADGALTTIGIGPQRFSGATATTTVTFGGNLSSSQTTQTISGIKVIDSAGGEHTLTATFDNNGSGSWTVTFKDGTTTAGTGTIKFVNGQIDPSASKISIDYSPAGMGATSVTFDFGSNVTSFASGSLSTLAMDTQNGVTGGELTKSEFDNSGQLVLTYSNGQTVKGAKLALSRFDTMEGLDSVGDNELSAESSRGGHVGTAGSNAFGNIKSGFIEMSNVDLSLEFSNLVITQRGYQASSQIVSTANDMLQELFSMKGK
jgi:flagellar hook protein FlgE